MPLKNPNFLEIKQQYLILFITIMFVVGFCAGLFLKNNNVNNYPRISNSENTYESKNTQIIPSNSNNNQNNQNESNDENVNNDFSNTANIYYDGTYTSQNINYANKDGVNLDFNLIKPKNSNGLLPVVIWIHGGGFGAGGTNTAKGFEDDFTKYGYAIAAVEYRSMEVAYFPAQIEDIKGAIRYMRANSSSLGIDPNNIFVLGTSSGGLVASLTGVTSGDSAFEGTTGGNMSYSSRPTAVIDLFGSVVKSKINDLSPTILPLTYEIFGCSAYSSCPERNNLAIDNYLDPTDPPFLIIHGTDDQTVPYSESTELVSLMQSASITTTFITAPGYGHDKDGIIGKYLTDIISFMNQY